MKIAQSHPPPPLPRTNLQIRWSFTATYIIVFTVYVHCEGKFCLKAIHHSSSFEMHSVIYKLLYSVQFTSEFFDGVVTVQVCCVHLEKNFYCKDAGEAVVQLSQEPVPFPVNIHRILQGINYNNIDRQTKHALPLTKLANLPYAWKVG